jgi:hypothetical protein
MQTESNEGRDLTTDPDHRGRWSLAMVAPGVLGAIAVVSAAWGWGDRLPDRLANNFDRSGVTIGTISLPVFLGVMLPLIVVPPLALGIAHQSLRPQWPTAVRWIAFGLIAALTAVVAGAALTVLVINLDVTDSATVHIGTLTKLSSSARRWLILPLVVVLLVGIVMVRKRLGRSRSRGQSGRA